MVSPWLDETYWNLIINLDESVPQLDDSQIQNYQLWRRWFKQTYIESSFLVNYPLLICEVINMNANNIEKTYYQYGGIASMYLQDNFQENSIYKAVKFKEVKLKVNQRTLVPFPDIRVYPYQLIIRCPYWLKNISLRVWQFIGDNSLLPDPVFEELVGVPQTIRSEIESDTQIIDNLDAKIDAVRQNLSDINKAIQNMNTPNQGTSTNRIVGGGLL